MSKWPKCPKCRTKNVELIEIWDAAIKWSPSDPYFNEGALEPGEAKHVEGKCLNCEHTWRMRGVIQVSPDWFEEKNI